MQQQLFANSMATNQFGRRTIPVSQPVYPTYANQMQVRNQVMFAHNRVVTNSGYQAYAYTRPQIHHPMHVEKPRQALSFIPAPVAMQPMQQYSFVPRPQTATEATPNQLARGLQNPQLSLFSRVGTTAPVRPLMQNFSYVPPPTRTEEPAPKPEKSLDLNWLGINITEDGDIEIHGTKENIEELRLHSKFHDVPVKFIDINAPVVPATNTPAQIDHISAPQQRKSLEEVPPLPPKKRILFIDPEGVLAKGTTNDFGLNEDEVRNLVLLAGLLGSNTQCVLACGSAHREGGLADRYYQGLVESGLPFAGMTEPQSVNTGLKLVGPDAVDRSTYCIKQMKADRCAEIRHYLERHPDADFVIIQAWGGKQAFGSVPALLDDETLQSHLVQCNESVDVINIYRYFEYVA